MTGALAETASLLPTGPRDNGTFRATGTAAASGGGRGDICSNDANASERHFFENRNHKTTFWQSYFHLLKGYIGCGVLSLPWAVSQLGIGWGAISILIVALWSSYNCWTVVKLKRYIEGLASITKSTRDSDGSAPLSTATSAGSEMERSDCDGAAVLSNITYPDVGKWAFGSTFQTYVTGCICTQQLAICTVFMSFMGENVLAVLAVMGTTGVSHVQVLSIIVIPILLLSYLPSLRRLALLMILATFLMASGLGFLAAIGWMEWKDRPMHPVIGFSEQAPSALCAILYSFEGICLILPVESAIEEPKEFRKAFTWSMVTVTIVLAMVACMSVMSFGFVSNGSITAFLLEKYRDDKSHITYLVLVNSAVSLSILLTYPLQLFPAIELIAPIFAQHRRLWTKDKDNLEKDRVAFKPLSSIDEPYLQNKGLRSTLNAIDSVANMGREGKDDVNDQSGNCWIIPRMLQNGNHLQLRTMLVLFTFLIASSVPNVASLVSLAGAVAGSSTALLIPPILELVWIKHHQQVEIVCPVHLENGIDDKFNWFVKTGRDSFLFEKVKSLMLLLLGVAFATIGTYASISDIVRKYRAA